MNTALAVLLLVGAVAAEAPYHLPRPAGHAPAFNLPAPAPPPPQARPFPTQFAPQPQPSSGYQYQQPSFAPTFAQPAPQHQFPAQHHHHGGHHGAHHQHIAPAPQPFQPSPAYFPPAPAPAPQPLPISYPQPAPISQPSPSYGLPQFAPRAPPPPAPIHHHSSYSAPQLAPQPLPQAPHQHLPQTHFHQSHGHAQPQFSPQQGYNYQQPQALPQFSQQIPLQAQPLSNHIGSSSLSSYQADSHQYSGPHEQTHRDALDSLVVGRVQNIIKEDEHSSARNAGFLSLVSGVSLENAKPSVEVTSFVHTSPLNTGSTFQGFSSGISGGSAPSSSYGLPSVAGSSQGSSSGSLSSGSFNFLPQSKPAQSYGVPY